MRGDAGSLAGVKIALNGITGSAPKARIASCMGSVE
jgi:hypothetical protein